MQNVILLPPYASRFDRTDELRREALARLYRRRVVVENLIRSLEDYQRAESARPAEISELISVRKCS